MIQTEDHQLLQLLVKDTTERQSHAQARSDQLCWLGLNFYKSESIPIIHISDIFAAHQLVSGLLSLQFSEELISFSVAHLETRHFIENCRETDLICSFFL